jgi:hypothetical protein
LEEKEAGGCGGWDRFRRTMVDGDGCVHLRGSWSRTWIYQVLREILAAFDVGSVGLVVAPSLPRSLSSLLFYCSVKNGCNKLFVHFLKL